LKHHSLLLLAIFFIGCANDSKTPEPETPVAVTPAINFAVAATHPHDINLFTEGLVIHKGKLFESTGSPENLSQTRSLVGEVNLKTGQLDTKIELDRSKYFGEGIVFLKDKLYQLTYQNGIGYVYDASSFKRIDSFTYKNKEGWALTTDGQQLIMSDGTNTLTYLDPTSLQPVKQLSVTENGLPLSYLNELEFINGFIYANIWQTNYIVKIDPATGHVTGRIDLSSLSYESRNKNPNVDVLNGIAYDSASKKIYVTGKLWPTIYEITFPH
jgi:glutaminyl-peptide cyclotransferase